MKLDFHILNTPFKYPFTISGNRTKTHQSALVVSLSLGNFTGYGEAPAITYYDVTVEKMVEVIRAKKMFIEKFALTMPERYWHYLHHLLPNHPFLVSALDMACWDLYGKMRKQPLYKMWQTEWQEIPLTDYTIGLGSIEQMVEKLQQNPWPIYKIKLGSERDIEIVKALRTHTDKPFRVDVNAGWTLEDALIKIPQLIELGVELIEQPLAKDNWDGMKKLYSEFEIPFIADESCVSEHDVQRCIGFFNGINIKLTKCSGITPALRMIKEARALGLKVMMGSMNETSLGSAAIANFLPQLDYVDMDGILLLNSDIATGLNIENGRVALQSAAGLGVNLLHHL